MFFLDRQESVYCERNIISVVAEITKANPFSSTVLCVALLYHLSVKSYLQKDPANSFYCTVFCRGISYHFCVLMQFFETKYFC